MPNKDDIILSNLTEGQYKSPTTVHVRRQSSYPSTFSPSRSFGGMSERNISKELKQIDEAYCIGMTGTLADDLLAHDNTTVIPKGSEIEIVDAARSLPDIRYDGNIISVDAAPLADLFRPYDAFNNQICIAIERARLNKVHSTVCEGPHGSPDGRN